MFSSCSDTSEPPSGLDMWFCLLVARCGMAVHRWGGEASVCSPRRPGRWLFQEWVWQLWDSKAWERVKAVGLRSQPFSPFPGGVAKTACSSQPLPGPRQIEHWLADSPPACQAPAKLLQLLPQFPLFPQVVITHYSLLFSPSDLCMRNCSPVIPWKVVLRTL